MKRKDGGMFGIKLILPAHLGFPYFTEPFDGFLNFSTTRFRAARPIASRRAGFSMRSFTAVARVYEKASGSRGSKLAA